MRKDGQIASRRCKRDGVKGMLFVFDICLTSACIMNKTLVDEKIECMVKSEEAVANGGELTSEQVTISNKLRRNATKTEFLLRLKDEVLKGKTVRERPVRGVSGTDPKEQHVLTDQQLIWQQQKQKAAEQHKEQPKRPKKGSCNICYAPQKEGKPMRYKTVWCFNLCQNCGKWFHLECGKCKCSGSK